MGHSHAEQGITQVRCDVPADNVAEQGTAQGADHGWGDAAPATVTIAAAIAGSPHCSRGSPMCLCVAVVVCDVVVAAADDDAAVAVLAAVVWAVAALVVPRVVPTPIM